MSGVMRFDKWENPTATKSVTIDQISGGSGLVPIVPTSVSLSAGSSTTTNLGRVSFSGTNYVSLNGIFTSGYSHYRIILSDMNASTNSVGFVLRMRNAGSDNSELKYYTAGDWRKTDGTSGNYSSRLLSYYEIGTTIVGAYGSLVMDMINPSQAKFTEFYTNYWGGLAAEQFFRTAGLHDVNTAFDGVSLIMTSGTMSGTIQVYGYR